MTGYEKTEWDSRASAFGRLRHFAAEAEIEELST